MENQPESKARSIIKLVFFWTVMAGVAWMFIPPILSVMFTSYRLPEGRFQIAMTGEQMVLMDTRTSQLYRWDGKWEPIEGTAFLQERAFFKDFGKALDTHLNGKKSSSR